MSLSKSLVNLFCKEHDAKGKITPKTAEFAAKWWAKFLPTKDPLPLKEASQIYAMDNSEGSKTISSVLDWARGTYNITPGQRDLFVKILAEKIENMPFKTWLPTKDWSRCAELSVDYDPPVEISDSLLQAGIIKENNPGTALLPFKTRMQITERDVFIDWKEEFHDNYNYNEDDSYLCSLIKTGFETNTNEL